MDSSNDLTDPIQDGADEYTLALDAEVNRQTVAYNVTAVRQGDGWCW